MAIKKSADRLISALETTMSGLTFSTDATSGLVRITDELSGQAEPASILELTPPPTPTRECEQNSGAASYLPLEILSLIMKFVPPGRQDVFAAASKVSRMWYHAATPFLYRHPKITGNNYDAFLHTISPTSHDKRSALGSLVQVLDLSALVHHGKPSLNARLLRRVQTNLKEFVAPQASFGYTCIVALGHCTKLQKLDLSLVSQATDLDALLSHIGDLPQLRSLNFPRTSMITRPETTFLWPKKLERFSLSGAIPDVFLHETQLPETLHELHISHCPFTKGIAVVRLLSALSSQLTSLSVSYPMPCLSYNALDNILSLCPNLTYLHVAVDYVSSHFFDHGRGHPLRRLDLDASGNPGVEHKVAPNDVFIAVAEDRLPALRIVRVCKSLKWIERECEDVSDLIEMLEAKSLEAGENDLQKVGVWEFGEWKTSG